MKRTPEPELMDEENQARAYSEADFSVPHEAFCDETTRIFPQDFTGRILDLGCGPADVTVRFARRYPQCSMLGIDGAAAMLELGQTRIEMAGLSERIVLQHCFLPAPDLDRNFDGVISNSLLHHLADPDVLWRTIAACTRQGGPIFIMDLMRPNSPEAARQLVKDYAADEPEILKSDFECSLHAAYRPNEIQMQLRRCGLAHLTVEVISDRHLIVYGPR